ncbi:MAG: hypothetical protein R2725_07645 [Solirubrobacterales bacterium]
MRVRGKTPKRQRIEVLPGAMIFRKGRAWKSGDRLTVTFGDGRHLVGRRMARRV